MSFNDPEAASKGVKRIEAAALHSMDALLDGAFELSPDPDASLLGLERWVRASSNPATILQALEAAPEPTQRLIALLGSSRHLGEVLTQNPELASLLLGPDVVLPTRNNVIAEGRRLLADCTSLAHKLDRLRFLKQKWTLMLGMAELRGDHPEATWRGISDLADGLIYLAGRVVAEGSGENITVVAFGKLGGCELNFSSDVDLIFLSTGEPGDDEVRYCERLVRALSDRMGRGGLYRVDLRLRPFGSRGAMACSWDSIEGYYERYAEPWERLALIRSRAIVGPGEERWAALRQKHAFPKSVSDFTVEQILEVWRRSREAAKPDDIKRARGGIRDIELYAQLNQHTRGAVNKRLQAHETGLALRELRADALLIAYLKLRHAEHALQLFADRQTHSLDGKGFVDRAEIERLRESVASRVAPLYAGESRTPELESGLREWFVPLGERFERSARESSEARARTLQIADAAPLLVPELAKSETSTELILSGEIAEEPAQSTSLREAWLRAWSRFALGYTERPDREVAEAWDAAMRKITPEDLTVVALGSFAMCEQGPLSDCDLVMFGPDEVATSFLNEYSQLRRHGSPMALDLRLRPDGRKGPLSLRPDAFSKYESTRMEPWERFAFAQSRVVAGDQAPYYAAIELALSRPLAEMLPDLIAVKHRTETEIAGHRTARHIKLGPGGLDDIRWSVTLPLMNHFERLTDNTALDTLGRISLLIELKELNVQEADALRDAHQFWQLLAWRIALIGLDNYVVPENPAKLDQLASQFELADGNELLSKVESTRGVVRAIFEDTLERLGRR